MCWRRSAFTPRTSETHREPDLSDRRHGPISWLPVAGEKKFSRAPLFFYPRFGNETEIVAMQRSHLAVLLALAFLTVWNTWGFGWGPEPEGHEDRHEAVTAGDDEANEKFADYVDAVEDCLDEAETLEAAKDCSDAEP